MDTQKHSMVLHHGRSEHVVMHQMPRFDADHSDLGSVSGMSVLQEDRTDEEYNKLVLTLGRKHAWRRKSLKVVANVIRMKLAAEKMLWAEMKSCEQSANPHNDDASTAPSSSADDDDETRDERELEQQKDLIEFIAGGTLIDIEARMKRLQEMNTRIGDLENEIAQQTKALPKLCKDIAKREQKLKGVLEKIKRKSKEIREDFRNCREKDRLRKRIEALKLEGKYFEVNQLERTNCDRKQTVANMLPELERREIAFRELICAGASSLRAQADAYEAAKKHLVVADPPIITRHVYTSDFLENGHPKGEPRSIAPSDMAPTSVQDESEITSSIWSTGTSQCGDGDDGCMGAGVTDTESVTGSEMSENQVLGNTGQMPMQQRNEVESDGNMGSNSADAGVNKPRGGSMRLSNSGKGSGGSGRMRGIGIRKKRAYASHGHASSRLMRANARGGSRHPIPTITHTTHNENDPSAMNQQPTQYAAQQNTIDGPRTPQNTAHRSVPPTPPSHAKRSARKNRPQNTPSRSQQRRLNSQQQQRENELAQPQQQIVHEEEEEEEQEQHVNHLAEQVANNLNLRSHGNSASGNRRLNTHAEEEEDLSPGGSPAKHQSYESHDMQTVSRTPSRSRSRNYDEALSPVQEQDEYHLATVGR